MLPLEGEVTSKHYAPAYYAGEGIYMSDSYTITLENGKSVTVTPMEYDRIKIGLDWSDQSINR